MQNREKSDDILWDFHFDYDSIDAEDMVEPVY
jgi:hypothetical protein